MSAYEARAQHCKQQRVAAAKEAATVNKLILRIRALPSQLHRTRGISCVLTTVPDQSFERCDSHHKMIDLRETPRSWGDLKLWTSSSRVGRGLSLLLTCAGCQERLL